MAEREYGRSPVVSINQLDGYTPVSLGALTVYVDSQSDVSGAVRGARDIQAKVFGGSYKNGVLSTHVKERKRIIWVTMGGTLTETAIEEAVHKALNSRRPSR